MDKEGGGEVSNGATWWSTTQAFSLWLGAPTMLGRSLITGDISKYFSEYQYIFTMLIITEFIREYKHFVCPKKSRYYINFLNVNSPSCISGHQHFTRAVSPYR